MILIDLEKVNDRVLWSQIWWILDQKNALHSHIDIMKDMYERSQ